MTAHFTYKNIPLQPHSQLWHMCVPLTEHLGGLSVHPHHALALRLLLLRLHSSRSPGSVIKGFSE